MLPRYLLRFKKHSLIKTFNREYSSEYIKNVLPTIGPDKLLNQNIRGLKPSSTVFMNEMQVKLREEGKQIYKFGFGQSPFPVLPSMEKSLIEHAHIKDYLPSQGLPQLRNAIAKYYGGLYQLDYDQNDVMIGPGSKELMYLLQLCYYGELYVPNPSWVSYVPQAKIIGRNINFIDTHFKDNWKLSKNNLIKLFNKDPTKPRILVLNYPSNPTSVTYSGEELEELAQIFRKYNVIVLSDEIYGRLQHNPNKKHVSIAKYYPEGTIISSGVSKWAGAGGWRLGAFIMPKNMTWLLEYMRVVASETFTSVSAPIQYACVPAFEDNSSSEIKHYLNVKNKILNGLSTYGFNRLKQSNVDVIKPDGGFYMMPIFDNVPNINKMIENYCSSQNIDKDLYTSREFSMQLLQDIGFGSLPGLDFYRPDNELSLRIAYVDFEGQDILDYINNNKQIVPSFFDNPEDPQFIQFLKTYCPNVTDGFDILCDYLDNL